MMNVNRGEDYMNTIIDMGEPKLPEIIIKSEEYKNSLRFTPEIRALADEIDLDAPDSTLLFGREPIMDFSRISDELINYIKFVESGELDNIEMFLSEIKSDILEKVSFAKETLDKNIINLEKSNSDLDILLEKYVEIFKNVAKYITAGELYLEETEDYNHGFINSEVNDLNKSILIHQNFKMIQEALIQRIGELKIAENLALETCIRINAMRISFSNILKRCNDYSKDKHIE